MTDENPVLRYFSILPNTPEERVLRLLIKVGIDITSAEEGSLLVLDEAAQELVFAMTSGSRESELALLGQRVPIGKGITGLAAMTREVQIGAPSFKDVRQTERLGTSDGNPSAVLAAPMLLNDEVIGVITAVSFDPAKRFSDRDARIYGEFAAIAALVTQQTRTLALGETLSAAGDSGADRRIIDSLRRILLRPAGSIEQVARLLESIEQLTSSGGS